MKDNKFTVPTLQIAKKILSIVAQMALTGVVRGGAFVPALAVVTAYVGLEGYSKLRDSESRAKLERLLLNLLTKADLSSLKLDEIDRELVVQGFDAARDREEILKRLELILSTVRSRVSNTSMKEMLQKHEGFYVSLDRFICENFDTLKDRLSEVDEGITERIAQMLARRPDLDLSADECDPTDFESNWFLYSAQRVPFVGRKNEMKRLVKFLGKPDDPSERFKWWLITGKAGSGKSRFALEFCLKIPSSWYKGFLRKDQPLEAWYDWRPTAPTLIVVDYASLYAEGLGRHMEGLYRRREEFKYPVRMLLLEREIGTGWLDKLEAPGSKQQMAIRNSRHVDDEGDILELTRLADDHIWHIVCFIFQERRKVPPKRGATLKMVKEVDPDRTPLFTAFAAEALAAGKDVHQWDQKQLIDFVVKRYERIWNTAGIDHKHKNLLVLSTMMGGIQLPEENGDGPDIFADPELKHILPTEQELNGRWYKILSGHPIEEELAPLEPDILGECFVLEYLTTRNGLDKRRCAKLLNKLRLTAWKHSELMFADFLYRVEEDFPGHQLLEELQKPAIETRETRTAWATMVIQWILNNAMKGPIWLDKSQRLFNSLREIVLKYPEEHALREAQSCAGVNLLLGYKWGHQLDTAVEIYKELCQLARDHPGETVLREQQAMSAVNVLLGYINAGQLDRAAEVYDGLRELAREHPKEDFLRNEQAAAALHLLSGYADASQPEAAAEIYEELHQLAREHPKESVLIEKEGEAAFQLVSAYIIAGQPDAAAVIYDALRLLAKEHHEEPWLASVQARAGFNLVGEYAKVGRLDAARKTYDELCELAREHPKEAFMRSEQAKAAGNLAWYYEKVSQLDAATEVYEGLRRLARDHPGEAFLREAQSMGGFQLASAYGEVGQFDAATKVYEGLRQLARGHPRERVLREQQAMAGFDLVYCYVKDGELGTAAKLHEELRQLAKGYPEECRLREAQAKAALALAWGYVKAGQMGRGRRFREQVRQLSDEYPEDEVLQDLQVKASELPGSA